MARIIKVRTVPRGYVKVEETFLDDKIKDIMRDYTPERLFMALYKALGTPQNGGEWSYMLRHNNVVLKLTYDGHMHYDVWVSPGYMQEARRKQTKVMNIIARRLNELDIVFIPNGDMPNALYYLVRKKNDQLVSRYRNLSVKEITEKMNAAMTDDEKQALYGGLTQYIPEVPEEIKSMIKEIAQ